MPYGVDKTLGGDSKENTAYMDKCVAEQKAAGKNENYAIAVCKLILRRHIAKQKPSAKSALNNRPGIRFTIE